MYVVTLVPHLQVSLLFMQLSVISGVAVTTSVCLKIWCAMGTETVVMDLTSLDNAVSSLAQLNMCVR